MKILSRYCYVAILFALATGLSSCSDDEVEPPEVTAGFTFTVEDEEGTVRFLNTSENAEEYQWDFGNGESSIEVEPVVQFESGTYTVTLTASREGSRSSTASAQLTIVVIEDPAFPITFDDENVDYGATVFGGTAFEIVENPDQSGSNAKAGNVGAITNSGAAFEGIFFDLEEPLDLSVRKGIKMNFWSDSPVDVLIKLEEGSGPDVEVAASHNGSGWDSLRFNFASAARFSRMTLFVDGPGTTAGTFYLDDIEQVEATALPVAPTAAAPAPTRAAADVISIFSDSYTNVPGQGFNLYGGAAFETVDLAGNSVLRYTAADNGFQVIELGGDNQIDAGAAGMTNLRFDLWFSNETTVNSEFLMKLVNVPPGGATEAEMRITPSSTPAIAQGQWLQYDFELADLVANTPLTGTANIQQLVIDLLNTGEVYIDNIYFYKGEGSGGGGGGPFDDGLLTNGDFEAGADPWLAGVGTTPAPVVTEGGNTYYSVNITSPDPGAPFAVNLSQKLPLTAGATYILSFDAWSDGARTIIAGIGRSEGDFANVNETVNITETRTTYTLTLGPIEFGEANNRVLFDNNGQAGLVNIDNVSLVQEGGGGPDTTPPVINLIGAATVNVKLGDPFTDPGATATDNVDGDISASITVGGDAVNTNALGTYTITYDVSDAAGNAATQKTRTVIVSEEGGGGELITNGDFEAGTNGWLFFVNSGTAELDNTLSNGGGSNSAKIATNGPSNPGIKQERFGIGTVQPGDVVQVQFDHIGSVTQPGAVFNVLLFVERAEGEAGDPITHVFDPRPSLAAEWSTFTATYTIPAGASVSGGISILIESVCGGDTGCSVSANVDNVSVTLNP